MNLEHIFYIIGIIYMGIWTLVALSLVILAVAVYKRLKKVEEVVKEKSSTLIKAITILEQLPLKKIIPIIGIIPIVTKIYSIFQGKK